jgi:hypothetical protein
MEIAIALGLHRIEILLQHLPNADFDHLARVRLAPLTPATLYEKFCENRKILHPPWYLCDILKMSAPGRRPQMTDGG